MAEDPAYVPEPANLTVAKLCDLFLAAICPYERLAPEKEPRPSDPQPLLKPNATHALSTYWSYKSYLQSFCDLFGRLQALAIKPIHVSRWLDSHPGWNGSRQNGIVSVKRAYNWALDEGIIERNPVRRVRRPLCNRRERVPTADERRQILDAIQDEGFRQFVFAMQETGARPGEVRKVTAAHFNEEYGAWVLPEHKTRKKTGRPRVIYLTPAMVELTRQLIAKWPEGPIFRGSTRRGQMPFTKNAIRCRFRRLRQKIPQLKGIVSYSYRHGFITDALERGVPVATVADTLFNIHRVPRQIVVEQNAGELKVDPLAARRRADQDARPVRAAEAALGGSPLSINGLAVDGVFKLVLSRVHSKLRGRISVNGNLTPPDWLNRLTGLKTNHIAGDLDLSSNKVKGDLVLDMKVANPIGVNGWNLMAAIAASVDGDRSTLMLDATIDIPRVMNGLRFQTAFTADGSFRKSLTLPALDFGPAFKVRAASFTLSLSNGIFRLKLDRSATLQALAGSVDMKVTRLETASDGTFTGAVKGKLKIGNYHLADASFALSLEDGVFKFNSDSPAQADLGFLKTNFSGFFASDGNYRFTGSANVKNSLPGPTASGAANFTISRDGGFQGTFSGQVCAFNQCLQLNGSVNSNGKLTVDYGVTLVIPIKVQ